MNATTTAMTLHQAAWTLATVLVFLLAPAAATAQTSWQGGTGDWFDPANWTAGVPTSTSDATIDNSGTAQIELPGAAARDVFVGRTSSNAAFLEITGGGTLANRISYLGRESGSRGTVTVTGSGSKLTNSSSLYVGNSGTGTLNIEDGGQVSNTYGRLGSGPRSQGTATVTGNSSTWVNSFTLLVGCDGNGTLRIEDGGQVSNTYAHVGSGPSSQGTATVTGAGSQWTNSAELYVGFQGTGTLTVADGGLVTARTLYASLGDLHGNGTISAKGGVLDSELLLDRTCGTRPILEFGTGGTFDLDLDGSGHLGAGYRATGALTITDAVQVASRAGYLGYWAGSQGTATVIGSGSRWINSFEDFHVGHEGAGTLRIEAGGVMSNTMPAYLGSRAGSQGTATVTGAGSQWTNYALYVGNRGTGTLAIADGAEVSSEFGILGCEVGSQGTVTVTGTGSMWTNLGTLRVGSITTGILTIANGGQVSNTRGYLGWSFDSQGTATVTGAGSKWINSATLYVGDCGFGTLVIADGGEVSNTNGTIGFMAGSEGTVTVTGNGATWMNSQTLRVGSFGTGTLLVADGGRVSNTDGILGATNESRGTATVTGGGSVWTTSANLYVGREGIGTLTVADGGLVIARTLYASLSDLLGDGTITVTSGALLDADLLFNSTHGTTLTMSFGTGGILNLEVDGRSVLGAGYRTTGTLTIAEGVQIGSPIGYLGYSSGSRGTATLTGIESKWTSSGTLYVGYHGTRTLTVEDGGQVSNTDGHLGRYSGSQGTATVTGSGSTWTNSSTLYVGSSGRGTLRIADGGEVSATSVSINSLSLLSIDIGQGSLLTVGSTGAGTITNNGTVRILAGADAITGVEYAPIAAGSWSGTGSYVGVGGTWNAASRRFIASEVEHGASGAPILIDLAQRQRALVDDGPTGWSLGASFRAKTGAATQLTFTATAASGSILDDLIALVEPGQIVQGAWELSAAGSGYTSGDPIYLSFDVSEGFSRSDLNLWHHDGLQWSPFSAPDLSYNGQYASFTVTSFSAYAVAAVPEPGTWAMLLAALLGLTVWHRRRKR